MAEYATLIVETSLMKPEAQRGAAAAAGWLLERAITVADGDPAAVAWMRPGPQVTDACPRWHMYPDCDSSVKIHLERQIYHAAGNYEAPSCARCHVELDTRRHIEAVKEWFDCRVEPQLRCPACGYEDLVGDWPGEVGLHVGEVAIEFHNWPPLDEDFLIELGRRLGPRPRLIYQRI